MNKKTTKTNSNMKANTKATANIKKRRDKVTREELPQCFLNEGESFTWLIKGGISVEKKLPYVNSKYEEALKENGIPYRFSYIPDRYNKGELHEVCEYWNPECPMLEKTLPVYIKSENSDDMYVFTGDHVTREVVSGKVAHLANKLDSVKYACAKFDLGGKIATVVRRSKKHPDNVDLEGTDGGSIKILQVWTEDGKPTGLCGIFDMKEVAKRHYIELNVPQNLKGMVIGKGGQNKGRWDYMLGDKNVMVVAE